jgi:hypothetical protein
MLHRSARDGRVSSTLQDAAAALETASGEHDEVKNDLDMVFSKFPLLLKWRYSLGNWAVSVAHPMS